MKNYVATITIYLKFKLRNLNGVLFFQNGNKIASILYRLKYILLHDPILMN